MSDVVILTSGVGLGVYIPALLLRQQLRQLGVTVTVEVLEDFYTPQKQLSHVAHGQAHHANFALAQLAHRMARDVQDHLDGGRLQALLQKWAVNGCNNFIVWSGFWLPILEHYRNLFDGVLTIDHCCIDAEISASFKIHPELQEYTRKIWLWHGDSGKIIHEIGVGHLLPLSFEQRDARLMVHGGGWGIGTYQERAKELADVGFSLDLVIHEADEAQELRVGDCAYQLAHDWRTWQRDSMGQLQFPPMNKYENGEPLPCIENGEYHSLYDVIRSNQAIISKPGGCTLIDSLASATPVILLEPYGYAEVSNSEIWQRLGYGISYADWQASGYSMDVLARLQNNLLNRAQRGIDYPTAFANNLHQKAI
jgi:hypothetical protein